MVFGWVLDYEKRRIVLFPGDFRFEIFDLRLKKQAWVPRFRAMPRIYLVKAPRGIPRGRKFLVLESSR